QLPIDQLEREMVGINLRKDIGGACLLAVAHRGVHRDLVLVFSVLVPDRLSKATIEEEGPRSHFFFGLVPADPLNAAGHGYIMQSQVKAVDQEIPLVGP